METTLEGVCLVGTRERSYNEFTARDGRKIEAGTTYYVVVAKASPLGVPVEVKVGRAIHDMMVDQGFASVWNIRATGYAKNSRIELVADLVVNADTGEPLRAAS